MRYLIDTNIWIFYLKRPDSPIRHRLEALAPGDIAVPSIVWAELMHGAQGYENSTERVARVEKTLRPFACLAFDLKAAYHYADIRRDLEKRGQIIGGNDLIIAAITRSKDLTLVTNNVREFSRVNGLRTEDWSV